MYPTIAGGHGQDCEKQDFGCYRVGHGRRRWLRASEELTVSVNVPMIGTVVENGWVWPYKELIWEIPVGNNNMSQFEDLTLSSIRR